MAMTLTYPERVTDHNLSRLRQLVVRGAGEWPGANFIVFPSGDKVFLKFGDRRRMAAELRAGDIVERHLQGELLFLCSLCIFAIQWKSR
jgi:DNA-directed RNA polymerase III subunit RPC1